MAKNKLQLLLFDSYMAALKGSVGTKIFQKLYAQVGDKKIDITKAGELSCAVFVSSILLMFGLVKNRHAVVHATVQDMHKAKWHKIKKPKLGSILVWEEKEGHKHIGFYIGKNIAISNDSKKRVPARHHWTYNNKIKVESIWWNNKLK